MESTAAAWHDFHYAALQRDRNIGKSLALIRQQIYARHGVRRFVTGSRTVRAPIPTFGAGGAEAAPPFRPDQKKPSFFGL
ncbi:hypothetical protein [Bradyrhizobium sp. NC92]|uniref:hypothetical protein n=1 Tax=Bradyrhizobium sp. (strain NC92) TaxID=55395 RepID=UPI0021AA80D4|nr:hypothetical protein [Bradyrhizobium sp. NC92]UWU65733.1 hypothetical protein N2602_20950 [Bradyrhizobium sp. NC92]